MAARYFSVVARGALRDASSSWEVAPFRKYCCNATHSEMAACQSDRKLASSSCDEYGSGSDVVARKGRDAGTLLLFRDLSSRGVDHFIAPDLATNTEETGSL